MKKYITPAVELTAMRTEGMMVNSFAVGGTTGDDHHDIVVGGSDDDSKGVGQLTNGYGWSADDWSE